MATISEIRAQYPQYADMPDAALADALYKKFYSDIPRSTFDAKVGLASVAPSGGGIPGPRARPTTYEKVREFAAPTVEALGAAGGAALGTPLGPLGIVGGAGLGYGMAKEALNLADIYIGGKAPRAGTEAVVEPVRNVLEGATYEAGGRVAGNLISAGVGKVADLRQLAQQKAAKLAQAAVGNDLPQVVNALRTASPTSSVAELTAKIENPTWQALIQDALQKDPQFLRKMRLMGEAESTNALAQLAGGTTAAATRGTTEAAKNALTTVTGPAREAALARGNLGKTVSAYETEAERLARAAAGKVEEVRFLEGAKNVAEQVAARVPVRTPSGERIGQPLMPGRYSYPADLAKQAENWSSQAATGSLDLGQGARFAQGAADAMRAVGIKPLEAKPLIEQITAVLSNPKSGIPGNDVLEGAVKNVANDIAKWTNNAGIVDMYALEAIRKNSVNAAIQQLRPGADATTQRNLASSVLAKIRPLIDDAIESSGGAGWKQYNADYTKGMQRIAEKKLAGEALQMWKTNKDAFVRLVQNESPETVEKILGKGNYNIATELADSTLKLLETQAQKHLTQMSVKEQATEGQKALTQLVSQQTSNFRFPSWLNFWTTAGNQAISELEKKIGTKSMKVLTEAAKSPQTMADLLERLPGAERNRVAQLLSNPQGLTQKLTAPVTIGVTNALAPAPESQNALAP
jgi:hypothetical protein